MHATTAIGGPAARTEWKKWLNALKLDNLRAVDLPERERARRREATAHARRRDAAGWAYRPGSSTLPALTRPEFAVKADSVIWKVTVTSTWLVHVPPDDPHRAAMKGQKRKTVNTAVLTLYTWFYRG